MTNLIFCLYFILLAPVQAMLSKDEPKKQPKLNFGDDLIAVQYDNGIGIIDAEQGISEFIAIPCVYLRKISVDNQGAFWAYGLTSWQQNGEYVITMSQNGRLIKRNIVNSFTIADMAMDALGRIFYLTKEKREFFFFDPSDDDEEDPDAKPKVFIHVIHNKRCSKKAFSEFKKISNIAVSPQGILYVIGIKNKSIVLLKLTNLYQYYELSDLSEVYSVATTYDGTPYIFGRDNDRDVVIVTLRDATLSKPIKLGITSEIEEPSMTLSRTGALIISGLCPSKSDTLKPWNGALEWLALVNSEFCFTINKNEITPLKFEESDIKFVDRTQKGVIYFGTNNTVYSSNNNIISRLDLDEFKITLIKNMFAGYSNNIYIEAYCQGEDKDDYCILKHCNGQTREIFRNKVPGNMKLIQKAHIALLLNKNTESLVFPHEEPGFSFYHFKQLCNTLKNFVSTVPNIDGPALFNFFNYHWQEIRSSQEAREEMAKLLESYLSDTEHPLYGYALTLQFEASGLQDLIYLADANFEESDFSNHKNDENFHERLSATKEAAVFLASIIKYNEQDFAMHYVLLWEKIMRALDILDDK